MPSNKDLKRLVRARMDKTGEAYTAARAQLLKKPARSRASRTAPAPVPSAPIAPPPDYAKLAGMSDDKVHAKTGRTWSDWVHTLDTHGAATMAHRDIAMLVSTTYGAPDWWTQMVTVGYERIKGIRARGQRRDGTYEANKSKTFNVPVTTLFDAWAKPATRRQWLDETGMAVRTATRPKYMRLDFADGSRVLVGFSARGRGKSAVAVQHTRLPDRTAADGVKRYWSDRLAALAVLLSA